MMEYNKQIEKMTKDLCDIQCNGMRCNICDTGCEWRMLAIALYNAGYRKSTDVAREIFEEIENALFSSYYSDEIEDSMLTFTLKELDEVKHKHLNEDFFVKMTGFVEPIIPRTIESIADLAFPESEGEG